jgi:hypothetical protein
MQSAGVVLSVLRERGRKGLPFTQLYRQMFNKDLYLLAYGNIYSNRGAMTLGASEETADAMSEEDRPDRRADAIRAVPVRPGPPHLYPEEEREAPSPRIAIMVRQAGRRGGPPPAGGDLRAGVL